MLENIKITNHELVIGLVGAVGSSLSPLTDIVQNLLEQQFNYQVEIIRVSKDILAEFYPYTQNGSAFDRIQHYMDKGNELRRDYQNDFLALQIVKQIYQRRQAWQQQHPKQDIQQRRVAYIVDSLKHEAEIQALRQIYGNGFFQLSLYEAKTARTHALVNKYGMSEDNAKILIERDEGEANSYGQHTSEAFHLADYFLKFEHNLNHLRESCLRFLKLIFKNPYITPTFNEFAAYMSFSASLRSADLSRQVGAVVARDETILAIGSNDVPKFRGGTYWPYFNEETGAVEDVANGRDYMRGYDVNTQEKQGIIQDLLGQIEHVIEREMPNERRASVKTEIENILRQSKIKNILEYGRVVHAEMDALLSCSRSNISTVGATLFVTTFPCHNCAKHILAAGIEKVVFVEPYPKSLALHLHDESITQRWEHSETDITHKLIFEPFVGVGARSFMNLFSLSLGVGEKLKRKDAFGHVLNWQASTATLRMPLHVLSYQDLEAKIMQVIAHKKPE